MASTNHLVAVMPLGSTAAKFHHQHGNKQQASTIKHRTHIDTKPATDSYNNLINQSNKSSTAPVASSYPRQIQINHVTTTHLNANSENAASKLQDGKRTLIKNQLHLIERLQLENANLRNERDQLQLENEELKFQLQIISSSNILNQPGSAFTTTPNITNDSRTTMTNLSNHSTATAANILHDSSAGNNEQQQNTVTSRSGLARITATPLRKRAAQANGGLLSANDIIDEKTTKSKEFNGSRGCRRTSSSSELVVASQQQQFVTSMPGKSTIASQTKQQSQLASLPMTDPGNHHRFLADKSSSLASFNVNCQHHNPTTKSSSLLLGSTCSFLPVGTNTATVCCCGIGDCVGASTDATQDNDSDEQTRALRLVCQRLNTSDCERLVAACVIIQRAFRKYQICKRFRMITEQLRHTCQSQTVTNEAAGGNQSPESNARNDVNASNASGTTRTAAWESLSHAASQLAAAAAKQVQQAAAAAAAATNGNSTSVTKSASSQQVDCLVSGTKREDNSLANNTKTPRSTSATPSLTVAVTTDHQNQSGQNIASRDNASIGAAAAAHMKSSDQSVVAAAINFQQLEALRKRQYRVGLNIFNKNPEKGISFLITHSFIDCSPPSMKSSTNYYLANQLHFIDKQNIAQQQAIQASCQQQHQTQRASIKQLGNHQQSKTCQLCFEEENLKRNIAHFLLHRKGLAKEKIGQYLGNLQSQFNQDVLKYYLLELDFVGLQIDTALRRFSSTLRMPGEAQKIERFVDYFAQRYVQCQQQTTNDGSNQQQPNVDQTPLKTTSTRGKNNQQQQPNSGNNKSNNLTLLSKDEIFILTFAIIMLNTDLHSPSLKSQSRMSGQQFINNLRGVFKSRTISENDLMEIYERVKAQQITTAPDHVTHVMKVQQGLIVNSNFQKKDVSLPNLCVPHRRLVCFCRLYEVYDINKKERVGQHQREIFLFNDMLLVTKLARRSKANYSQQYTYRQSIPLLGLYVQLFQSVHYNFGIRFCRRSNNEILIMFNARNELDQSRFVDDLSESIAEMEEMETIRTHNVIEIIHSKHHERLKRHAALHEMQNTASNDESRPKFVLGGGDKLTEDLTSNLDLRTERKKATNENLIIVEDKDEDDETQAQKASASADLKSSRRLQSKFSSMSDLSDVPQEQGDNKENEHSHRGDLLTTTELKTRSTATTSSATGLRWNRSFAPPFKSLKQLTNNENDQRSRQAPGERSQPQPNRLNVNQRSCSTSSVHSLDSGLFLSRDVSPNQSG